MITLSETQKVVWVPVMKPQNHPVVLQSITHHSGSWPLILQTQKIAKDIQHQFSEIVTCYCCE